MAPGPKQGLSLASFIVGLAAFVFSWIIGLGLLPGIVAVILGFKGKKSEPGAPSWMSLVGIISGFVAIGLSLVVGFVSLIVPLIWLSSVGTLTY
jgi:hypothetical protein